MNKEKRELKKYLDKNLGMEKKKTSIFTFLSLPFLIRKSNRSVENYVEPSNDKKTIEPLIKDEQPKIDGFKNKLNDHDKYSAFDMECCEDFDYSKSVVRKSSTMFRSLLVDEDINNYIDSNKGKELSFQKLLFRFIDRTDMLDSDVYTSGGIDRRLFSKIRNNEEYHPSKETVIQLGIGLKLNIDDLSSLLASASYTLSKNNYFDLIIRFCFEKKIYSLVKINEFLYDYNCRLLGRED